MKILKLADAPTDQYTTSSGQPGARVSPYKLHKLSKKTMRREPISRYILGEASSGDLRFKLGAVCRDFSPESIDKISTHTASLTLTGKSPANKSVAA